MSNPPNEVRNGVSDTKQNFSKVVNQVAAGDARVVVEKNGLPVAAIISAKDYELFKLIMANRARQLAAMDRISEAFAHIPEEELEEEVNRIVAEDRARYRTDLNSPAKTAE